jgi:ribonuclease Z
MQLRRYGFSFLKIREIFISHIHGDHIFGLPGLLSSMSMMGRREDLDIFAPQDLAPILKSYLRFFGNGFQFNVNLIKVKGKGLTSILKSKRVEVFSFPLNHRINCYGYLFRESAPDRNVHKHLIEPNSLTLFEIARLKEGMTLERESGEILENSYFTYQPYTPRSFAYCSDTAPFDGLAGFVQGCDLLYHESTFAYDMQLMAAQTLHSTAAEAASCAQNANVGKLLIGHFSSRYKSTSVFMEEARAIFPLTYEAKEGQEFDIPIEKHYNNSK